MGRNRVSLINAKPGHGFSKEEIEARRKGERAVNIWDGEFNIPIFIQEDEIASECFIKLVEMLAELEVYSNFDEIIVGQYCQLFSQYVSACEALKKEGSFVMYTNKGNETNLVESASSKLCRTLITSMNNLAKNLPFDPINRLKFVVEEKKVNALQKALQDDEDDIDE